MVIAENDIVGSARDMDTNQWLAPKQEMSLEGCGFKVVGGEIEVGEVSDQDSGMVVLPPMVGEVCEDDAEKVEALVGFELSEGSRWSVSGCI